MFLDSKNITSPLTGGKVSLHWEWRDVAFRKECFRVLVPFYVCEDTKEQFTTTESDNIWFSQIRNQYCCKFGIPFTDEIIAVRNRYGISASKMSLIMGFGENQWRKYEQGEIPSLSNGKMIRSIMNPKVFMDLLESSKMMLSDSEYDRIAAKVKNVISASKDLYIERYETRRIFNCLRSEDNGFAQLSLARLKNIMIYVLQKCGDTYCTKMNKLLFYIDFLAYRERCMAITGLRYKAIDYGPVPEHWDRVYSQFDEIEQETQLKGDFEGNVLKTTESADMSLFSMEEIEVIDAVCSQFKSTSAREISTLSHKEKAWVDNQANHGYISFDNAFSLSGI